MPLNRLSMMFVSTYPPRECGIATFTQDLLLNIVNEEPGIRASVCAIDPSQDESAYGCLSPLIYPKSRVSHVIKDTDPISFVEAAQRINATRFGVINIQHEYGLYGGSWGSNIIEFMEVLEKPIITTLHTVLPKPPSEAKAVTREIYSLSDGVVVPGQIGADILENAYGLDPAKITVIPHGVPDVPFISTEKPKRKLGLSRRFVLATFGLLHPAKGIDFVLEALPHIIAANPRINIVYLIVGETHPNIVKNDGERYRERLKDAVKTLGLETHVHFVDRYLTNRNLILHYLATDICVLPYLGPDQISSGVLSQAIGCGKAIVSTPYLHAKDALSDERGLLVRFGDPSDLADKINTLVQNDSLRREMEIRTYMYGRSITWREVARKYIQLCTAHFARRPYDSSEVELDKSDADV
ncbi:MAG: glycosyltransferase family 4 protein [Euryarchaeota archaeon]|nr:glycosyltransferase family 4 protein [Euryarchaeota archaeon]